MNSKILKFIFVVSLILNFSMIISAGYVYYGKSQGRTADFGSDTLKGSYSIEGIDLSADQRYAIRQKAISFHVHMDQKRDEIGRARLELLSLMRAEHPEIKVIQKKIEEISILQQELQGMATNHMLEIKGLLNRGQQKQFFDLVEGAMSGKVQMKCPW
jgi:Spy/CpxP family protein refolding chaperone